MLLAPPGHTVSFAEHQRSPSQAELLPAPAHSQQPQRAHFAFQQDPEFVPIQQPQQVTYQTVAETAVDQTAEVVDNPIYGRDAQFGNEFQAEWVEGDVQSMPAEYQGRRLASQPYQQYQPTYQSQQAGQQQQTQLFQF